MMDATASFQSPLKSKAPVACVGTSPCPKRCSPKKLTKPPSRRLESASETSGTLAPVTLRRTMLKRFPESSPTRMALGAVTQ